jgi:hypothetical protein
MSKKGSLLLWISRICIGIVVIFNLECAAAFVIHPEFYVSQFELSGLPGNSAVAGFGILFFMWNIPYLFSLINPVKFRVSLIESNIMQGIGFISETFLFLNINSSHTLLRSSIFRFIVFDGIGVLLLWTAFCLCQRRSNKINQSSIRSI